MPGLRAAAFALVVSLSMGSGLLACALFVGPIDGHLLFDGGADSVGSVSEAGVASDAYLPVVDAASRDVADTGSVMSTGPDAQPAVDASFDASFQGKPIVIASAENNPEGIAVTADALYWSDVGNATLRRLALDSDGVPVADAGPVSVYSFAQNMSAGASDLILDGTTLYALVGPNTPATATPTACHTFFAMPLSNLSGSTCSRPNVACSTSEPTTSLAVDVDNVYLSEATCQYVMQSGKPGTSPDGWSTHGSFSGAPAVVASDGTTLYYALGRSLWSWSEPLSGSMPGILFSDSSSIGAILADNVRAYWMTTGSSGQIESLPAGAVNGDRPTVLAMGQELPRGMTMDEQGLFWTSFGATSGSGTIWTVPKDGSAAARFIAQDQAQPWAITVNPHAVYWTDPGDNCVMMMRR
jgi:hypothetical protein